MTADARVQSSQPDTWESLILSERPAPATWAAIFKRLGDLSLTSSRFSLHRDTIVPDLLLAKPVWDLWRGFPTDAPRIVDSIRFFCSTSQGGAETAVLVLDALSLRE